jgi:hypothetical protein
MHIAEAASLAEAVYVVKVADQVVAQKSCHSVKSGLQGFYVSQERATGLERF